MPPESQLEFSQRRRDIVALTLAFSLLLHGALYFALRRGAPPPWPRDPPSSALFGATFEVDALPPSEAAQGARSSEPVSPAEPTVSLTSKAESPSAETRVEPSEQDPAPLENPDSEIGDSPAAKPAAIQTSPPKPPAKLRAANRATAQKPAAPSPARAAQSPVSTNLSAPASSQNTKDPGESTLGGAYGQQGAARARASLFAAFVRTLPLAGKLLPGWLDAPLGQKSKLLVELRVDASGRLEDVEIVRGDTKSLLARTALKNEAFLGHGTFAIQGEQAGQLLIELSSKIEEREPSQDPDASGRVVALGQRIAESPAGRPPTGAYFTYGNGRHIELSAAVIELSR